LAKFSLSFPLFGKEGSGEIFRTILLVNYELLSKR